MGEAANRHEEGRRYGPRDATFLAEASRLLADSLDYESTLATVARLALPHLGAWCIVDIVEDETEIRRLAVIHPDPSKQELARRLKDGWPPSRDDPLGVPLVARSRRSQVVPTVDVDLLREAAKSAENLEILQELGIGSLMTVPLVARGDVLGAITFVGPAEGHHYTDDDLALAEDLAARAAIAIDNARLYLIAERAREAAELASRAKSQFLGVMSHELRTPINAILGYSQLLDMGVKGPLGEEQRRLLQRIEASGKHLLDLVTRILDVSKAETGELTVQSQVTLVEEVVRPALESVRPVAPENVPIVNECTEGGTRFLGDAIRARQVLVHLLTNACRFTRSGGRITVRCESVDGPISPERLRGSGPWVRIDVEDTGSGIPQERLEAIFEPFVQADVNRYTREVDGTGLGLAISRYLARLMGGEITVKSEQGVGSRFSLWLPGPREAAEARWDRRLFDREEAGLPLLADHLLQRLKPIVDTYVDRIRRDGGIPRGREASEVALRDHIPHFLSGLASLLSHPDSGGEDVSSVLRGGNAIQRMTLELHGAQRRRLGWTVEAVRRDLDLLRQTIELDIRRSAPDPAQLQDALAVLGPLFEQAERISLQGWQYADSDAEGDRVAASRRWALPTSPA